MDKKQAAHICILVLTAFLAFGLGRLSKIEESRPDLVVESLPEPETRAAEPVVASDTAGSEGGEVKGSSIAGVGEGKYVASKSGSKFHYPWCPGASQIKDSNKIWFDTKEAAVSAGYGPAANCPGL